jgi:single-stranded-DNA-specific exonuclease
LRSYFYQPQRFTEGYGLHLDAVKNNIIDKVSLLISVDCGTSNFETATFCKENNLDLIITDHHKVGDSIPDSYAFVNPHGSKDNSIFYNLAGVGIAYYLIVATRTVLRDRGFFKTQKEPNLADYLDIVSFGTISDVVPLTGINRVLVQKGIQKLNSINKIGLKQLIEISSVKGNISTETIGFMLAPRLNASGRMGDASRSVRLLMSSDIEKAKDLAEELNKENQKRVDYQNKAWEEILLNDVDVDNAHSLTFYSKHWHQGILGIVASKAVDKWNKPSVIFTLCENGIAKGSGRSIPSVNLFEVFSEIKDIFENFWWPQTCCRYEHKVR